MELGIRNRLILSSEFFSSIWEFDSTMFQLIDFFSPNEIKSRATLTRIMQRSGFPRKNSQVVEATKDKRRSFRNPLSVDSKQNPLFPQPVDQAFLKCNSLDINWCLCPTKKDDVSLVQLSWRSFQFNKVKDNLLLTIGYFRASSIQMCVVNLQKKTRQAEFPKPI